MRVAFDRSVSAAAWNDVDARRLLALTSVLSLTEKKALLLYLDPPSFLLPAKKVRMRVKECAFPTKSEPDLSDR
jgi:hypothetical protein